MPNLALKRCNLAWPTGWGMLVCAAAMVYAATIEAWRLDVYRAGRHAGGPLGAPERVPISIMWQSPAYILVGASEVLASVGQLEFFYDQVG
jgi:hypothetical protein